MKIVVDLLQSTGTKGGIESYIKELYAQFGSMQTDHEFIGLVSSEIKSLSTFSWFPGELHRSKHSGENRIDWAVGEAIGVANFAEAVKADLIHAPAMLGPVHSKVPVSLTVHDLSYFTHPHLMRNRLLTPGVKLLEKLAASNAKTIIAISESTARLIPKYLGSSAAKKVTTVMSAGALVEPCKGVKANSSQGSIFIAMGQRSPYKSLETAVLAISLMPKETRPKLVITGSHGNDPLKPLVQKLGVEEDVELLGWIDDSQLRELMCSSRALVETTVAAGFGMPAVEALTMGIPVIASDIPVFREILADAALFFEPGNESDLALKLDQAINSDMEMTRLKAIGPSQASKYSWAKTALETMQVFERTVL